MAIRNITNDDASGTCLGGDHGTTDVGPILSKINEAIDQLNLQKNDIHFSFEPSLETDRQNYRVGSRFIFRGSAVLGTPSAIKAIIEIASALAPGDIRIYDKTNDNQICELTGIDVEDVLIYDLGPLSNISEGEAIWEIQIRVPSQGDIIEVKALNVHWPV